MKNDLKKPQSWICLARANAATGCKMRIFTTWTTFAARPMDNNGNYSVYGASPPRWGYWCLSPGRAAAPMPSWVVSMEQSAKRQKVEVGGLFRDFWHWVQAHIHRKHEFWITRHSTVYPLSYRSLGLTLEGPKLDLLYLKKFGAFCTIRFFLRFRILECYVADLYVQFFDFGFWILSFLGAEFGTSLWFYIR